MELINKQRVLAINEKRKMGMAHQNSVIQTYTTGLEDEMWNVLSEDYDESRTLDFLNSSAFRSFGESLASIIQRKMPSDEQKNPQAYLKKCAQEKGIDIVSTNTYTNWFKHNLRPKKSQESREAMFRIAFALDLDLEETSDLFRKAYLDRAFDHRRYQEIIYYYCIDHGLSFHHAQKMINLICFDETEVNDPTIGTVQLKTGSANSGSEEELIHFINTHPHNFNLNTSSLTAQKRAEELKKDAIKLANKEVDRTGRRDEFKNRSGNSFNFLYSVMTEQPANNEHGTKTTFKNALLPKEIKQCFPQPSIFANSSPSYEEIRKMIILLYSYSAWYRVQFDHEDYPYEEYVDDLNSILFEVGMPTLYAGNPFDWLFMCCAIGENPLDLFRGILSEALEEV